MTEQKSTLDNGEPQKEAVSEEIQPAETPGPWAQAAVEPADSQDPRLAALAAELETTKNDYLRALAEVENTRRRAARDREEASSYAIMKFARDVLPVADNLRRALEAVDAEVRDREPVLDALTNGVAMTERELLAVLARHGVKPIQADGQPFDPHVHEAMFEVPDSSVANGTVVHVLEQGYVLHDRTLRPARVGISKGGPKAEPRLNDETARAAADAQEEVAQYERQSAADQRSSGKRIDEKL